MNTPVISIIVPVYNAEKYLRKCVDSILQQTYRHIEAILVDDGSPDECPAICDEYAKIDDRVRVIHKENGGVSSARNAGLDAANGEYIVFVDADDYIDTAYIETLYDDAAKHSADLVCSNNASVREQQIQICERRSAFAQRYGELGTIDEIMEMVLVWRTVTSVLFSVNAINGRRFSSLSYGEDTLFLFEICCQEPSVYVNDYTGYYYHVHDDSAEGSAARDPSRFLWRVKEHSYFYSVMFANFPLVSEHVYQILLSAYAMCCHDWMYISVWLLTRAERRELHNFIVDSLEKYVYPRWNRRPTNLAAQIWLYTKSQQLYTALVRANELRLSLRRRYRKR